MVSLTLEGGTVLHVHWEAVYVIEMPALNQYRVVTPDGVEHNIAPRDFSKVEELVTVRRAPHETLVNVLRDIYTVLRAKL